ncbi:MAG: hypothetical protein KKD39_02130 [Candidatus Altiarchaeota archaeon]|nr:hypothetical protein [Candidatus Altiarchaeota archaeon]
MRRGQIFTLDFIVAFILVNIVLLSTVVTWDAIVRKTQEDMHMNEMTYASERASENLISAGGEPFNWESDPENAKAVGLADERGILSQTKINALETLDDDADELLDFRSRLGSGNYKVYIRITNTTGHLKGEAGELPQGDTIINNRKIATMGNQLVQLDVTIMAKSNETTVVEVA